MPATSDELLLVGRERETAAIDAALAELASGRGRVVLLSGEPGIGKSTLARHAAAVAARHGRPVYWGFCWESGGAPEYWPWTQILRPLLDEQQPPPGMLARLGQLLPEVARDEQVALNPEQARFQLLESVRSLLEAVCRKHPLVLIFEDLHAADSDSLHLLHHIGRHITSLPLLLIGTYRDAEARTLADADPFWRTVRDARHLELEPLDSEGVRQYLARRAGGAPHNEQVQRLLAVTEGNPLFLSELTQLLDSAGGGDVRLPGNLQQVIRQHLKLLPAATEELLASASVVGRNFAPEVLAALAGKSPAEVQTMLEPAFDAGLVKHADDGSCRFSHVLHRDVLYQGLPEADRSLIHLAYAELIRKDIAAGSEDRWTELARHLEAAGAEHKPVAIEALRNAAARAVKRLAFEDAALLLNNALHAFGTGPKFSPGDRCRLLLECATATMLAGKVDAGQELCREAFSIARTLEDPLLMTTAALTWGNEFVVGKVDKNLVAALRECLEALPATAIAARAKALARLAAALQPAPNPGEPMEMARAAIRLARAADDEAVLYEVLRSAISALMDFGPIDERLPLHREFGALAKSFGDIPGRFRSSLRTIIDSSAIGDRDAMIRAIEDCDQLARRIDLPHYLWRAASVRAMQAMIEGKFDSASRLIEEAERQAAKIDEVEADITLPLQRIAILTEWEAADPHSLEPLKARLRASFAGGMEASEFFVTPFLLSYTSGLEPQVARTLLSDAVMLERAFATRDTFLIIRIAELALTAGDDVLAARALAELEPHQDECSSLGLMGSVWGGPAAFFMGKAAAALGRTEAAAGYFNKSLEIATRMKALPCLARTHLALARFEQARGNDQAAARHADAGRRICEQLGLRPRQQIPVAGSRDEPAAAAAFAMERQGDVWKVSLRGAETVVRDSRGMQMLAELTRRAGQEIHVLDLSGSDRALAGEDAGPALDGAARSQYKARIAELAERLDEARALGDLGQADSLQAELDFLTAELSRAFGIGGRERRSGSAAERARVNVRRRIKDAIGRIAEQNAELGAYLENTVKTGSYCKYSPM